MLHYLPKWLHLFRSHLLLLSLPLQLLSLNEEFHIALQLLGEVCYCVFFLHLKGFSLCDQHRPFCPEVRLFQGALIKEHRLALQNLLVLTHDLVQLTIFHDQGHK